MRNVTDETKPAVSLRPQDLSANVDGIGVDTTGFSSLAAHLEVGAVSGTTPTLDVKIQDSADNITFADIVGATFTQIIAADNSQELALENLNTDSVKKFVRLVATLGGTTPSFITSGVIVLGRARNQAA